MEAKSIKINSDLHQAVKVKASEEGKNISEWLVEAIKDKLGPTKRERILDEMAVNPMLRTVYDEVAIKGTLPNIIEKRVTDKNNKIRAGHIQQALERLKELEVIKEIPLTNPPAEGDQVVYRRLEWLKINIDF